MGVPNVSLHGRKSPVNPIAGIFDENTLTEISVASVFSPKYACESPDLEVEIWKLRTRNQNFVSELFWKL